MSTRAFFLFLVLAASFLWAYASRGHSVSPAGRELPEVPLQEGERRPVLVELFTSEGCSSCPPADALLIRLESDQPVEGAEVIALGFHVDYWDYIGWRDRFSSAEYSDRQRDYAEAFRGETVYTPQMIVDGHTEFVGNDARRAGAAIQRAALAAKSRIELTLSESRGNRVKLEARIAGLPADNAKKDFDLWLAVTESALTSRATRGENSGRQLNHTAVVREFRRVARLQPDREAAQQFEIKLDSQWKRENLRAVVFVQDQVTRRILGVAQVRLAGL
jgi:hypothetical protein